MENYCVATFHSVSQALDFEKLMLSLCKPVRLLPVPRVISSSCGIAARFPREMIDELVALVKAGQAEVEGVYFFCSGGGNLHAAQCPGPWGKSSGTNNF